LHCHDASHNDMLADHTNMHMNMAYSLPWKHGVTTPWGRCNVIHTSAKKKVVITTPWRVYALTTMLPWNGTYITHDDAYTYWPTNY
jgi:hypothetical protein